MTNEEAIRLLKAMINEMILAFDSDRRKALNMSIEALEKQISKKPDYKEEDRFVKNHFAFYTYCPKCGNEINAGDSHCVQCGQAIDWYEEG